MNSSPFLAMQEAERLVKGLLRQVDTDTLTNDEKAAMTRIRRQAIDTRLDIRDYELSETREEQLKCAVVAKRRLERLERAIVQAGTVFGPADVAHLSAQLEYIAERIV